MRIKCFVIPALTPNEATEELSAFLASHRILSIDRQFVADGAASYWALCVTHLSGTQEKATKRVKIDYRDTLSPADFAIFSRLRTLRKTLADREGVPAYALFTNDQLATMVTQRIDDRTRLGQLPGVGPARVEKYGEAFLEAMKGGSQDASA